MIRQWHRALQLALIDPFYNPLSRKLRPSLRVSKCIVPSVQWHSYIHLASNRLFWRSTQGWEVHFQGTRNNRHPTFFPFNRTVPSLPEGATQLVSLEHKGPQRDVESAINFEYVHATTEKFSDNPATYTYEYIHDAYEEGIDCSRILIDHIDVPYDECTALATSICQGTARAVSDGSYYEQYKIGASAFIISALPHKKSRLTTKPSCGAKIGYKVIPLLNHHIAVNLLELLVSSQL